MNKILASFVLATLTTSAFAQSTTNSPYSQFGLGDLTDQSVSFNKGMNGVGLGMHRGNEVNPMNPASYSSIDSLTFLFDAGMSGQITNYSENGKKFSAKSGGFDYVSALFRAFKNVGVSFGVLPYSNIGYNYLQTGVLDDRDETEVASQYEGEGGLHQMYIGAGIRPIKPLSVGFILSYLWGDYSHSSTVAFSETTIQSLRRNYNGEINTYTLDFGVQYTQRLSKKTTATLGLTAGLGHKIDQQARFINQKLNSGTTTGADTLRLDDAHELPSTFGAGIAVNHDDRWTVALDYTCQLWKDCRSPQLVTDNNGTQTYQITKNAFQNRQKIALGGQYVPNPTGIRFKDHISYRAGVSYATPYCRVDGHDGPKTYTASVGIGLPIINKYSNRSMVNIALEYQRVEPSVSHSIREQYFSLRLGLMFNARWFNKWKFE